MDDAERLCHDPAMRWVVGDRAIMGSAASASQMGRFETERLTGSENLAALTDLPGRSIDAVHKQLSRAPSCSTWISSESETYGDQEGSACNDHFGCTCYLRCLCSTNSVIWSGAPCGPETSIRLMAGGTCWSRWLPAIEAP